MKKKTIIMNVNILLIITVLIFLFCLILIEFIFSSGKMNKEMVRDLKVSIERLSITLSSHMWNFDKNEAGKLIDFEMKDDDIQTTAVYGNDNTVFIIKTRDKKWKIAAVEDNSIDAAVLQKLKFKIEGDINYSNQKLGKVYVIYTEKFIVKKIILNVILNSVKILIISLIMILMINLMLYGILIKPLNIIGKNIHDISEGDLTINLKKFDHYEVHNVGSFINLLVKKISLIIIRIKDVLSKTMNLGDSLNDKAVEFKIITDNISADIGKADDKTNNFLKHAQNFSCSVTELKNYINKVFKAIQKENETFKKLAAYFENFFNNITLLKNSLEDKKSSVKNISETAGFSKKSISDTVSAINDISKSAKVITEMIAVINNTANQTNLLSFNAAIEASHAGDSGRGFTVVADEIGSLAKNTSEYAKNISSSLKAIIEKIKFSSEVSEKANAYFGDIFAEMNGVLDIFSDSVIRLNEISDKNQSAKGDLNMLNGLIESIASSGKEMDKRLNDFDSTIAVILENASENKDIMSEIKDNIGNISQSVSSLAMIGNENKNYIIQLETEIKKFKLN